MSYVVLLEKHLVPENIDRIEITVTPYIRKLVEHQFQIAHNPRVNAQFSIQYFVANALPRKSSKLHYFEESNVKDPEIMELIGRIYVSSDPALEKRGHTGANMKVLTLSGDVYYKRIDIASGFPVNPLTQEEHERRFGDCIDFASTPIPRENAEKIIAFVSRLEELKDVRFLIPLLSLSGGK